MNISLNEKGVITFRKHWTRHEMEMCDCIGLHPHICDQGYSVAYSAPIYSMKNAALYELMKESFASFFDDSKRAERDMLFTSLKQYYDHFRMGFQQQAKSALPFYDQLFDHQGEGVFLGCCRQHNLISYEQGLGKSITAASISEVMNCELTLIVCPAICKWNWHEELISEWGFNRFSISVIDSRSRIDSPLEKFVIINYDILAKYESILLQKEFGHIILDEAHYIKNTSSNRHKSVARIIDNNPDTKVTFLTGTPIKNYVDDLFAYLKLVDHPLGKNKSSFMSRFTENTVINGKRKKTAKNPKRLRQLLSNFIERKTKKQCINIPDKIYHKFWFDIGDYRSAYNQALANILAGKSTSASGSMNLAVMTLNRITSLSKVKHICALTKTILDQGEPVILFTIFKDTIAKYQKFFGDSAVTIDGSVPTHKRQGVINRFKTDDSCNVMIAQTIAAGIGINLTNCSNVIFCDLPFTHAELNQAMDRVHRIGTTVAPNIYFALCKGTIDTHLLKIVNVKQKDSDLILEGKSVKKSYGSLLASALAQELQKIESDDQKIQKVLSGQVKKQVDLQTQAYDNEEEGSNS